MKEYDFTPGPWHVSNEGKLVIRDDEWLVPVATAGYATNDEELATAKLIAAAPDLLEALQGYMSAVSEMNEAIKDGYNVQGAMSALIGWEDMARAAISKALGDE
ncbi:hypothetical protein UXP85_24840 [Enterobacter cloacae]|uniref:hypothetical protein n=1 Tax=Enterobacter cloacae TaxID=550 RepID=UPI002FD20327